MARPKHGGFKKAKTLKPLTETAPIKCKRNPDCKMTFKTLSLMTEHYNGDCKKLIQKAKDEKDRKDRAKNNNVKAGQPKMAGSGTMKT